ncbi:hypothetical protein EUTSA_v10021923mg [Eutrema salsugineum]|uniref:F-box domain-containing protein n=1 Tax=Eutrema salsugineum TaxID=72664 RepID=V4M0E5_EUTSA|nr:F-box protein At2g14710 [Eutrema salsugineum]ESQ48277.1 hypothetical protein EUTSA_v10021923mg [Eutrema salsugineum]
MGNGFNQVKKRKGSASQEEKLPWELIEEILSRVPPQSLVRFRAVCKRWNALFDDKTFINNHKSTFRFILVTESKIYSVSIDPKIVVREITLDIPGLKSQTPKYLVDCDEFLLCRMDKAKGGVVWNPWLKQSRRIKAGLSSNIHGIGYNRTSDQESVYKTIWSDTKVWKIHDFVSDTWKVLLGSEFVDSDQSNIQGENISTLHSTSGVSLNGIIYWVAFYDKTDPLYHLIYFDFSREEFSGLFCHLPCGMNDPSDALVLRVFKGNRFSLLKQCYETKKIEVWVTKNKVNVTDGDDVVWMNFMTLSIPNFPGLIPTGTSAQPSYFIDDKRLVVCSCDESGQAWIYVFGENKLIRKVQIDSVVDSWPWHCTCFPSLVPVPRGQRDELAESQV